MTKFSLAKTVNRMAITIQRLGLVKSETGLSIRLFQYWHMTQFFFSVAGTDSNETEEKDV